jgi:hypothetical protein
MLQLKKAVAIGVLGLGLSAFAQAKDFNLGTLYEGGTLNVNSVSITGEGAWKYYNDTFNFSIEPGLQDATANFFSIELSFDFGDIKIDSMWVNLYTKDGDRVFQANATGLGAPDATGAQRLELTGTFDFTKYPTVTDYYFTVSGGTVGSGYGAYGLTITAGVVPEPAEYAMLLAGLGLVGMIARRRKV